MITNYLVQTKIKNVQEQLQILIKKQINYDSQIAQIKNKTGFLQGVVDKILNTNMSSISLPLSDKKHSNYQIQNSQINKGLASNQHILSLVKKMEVNNLKNLQKIESYVNTNTQDLQNKFDKVQSKILNLLFQKQVILEQFSRQLQKSDFSIQAIQNYLKQERSNQNNSLNLFYDGLCEKIKIDQKNWQLKHENTLKQIQNVKLDVENFKSQVEINFQKISSSLAELQQQSQQTMKKYVSNGNFSSGSVKYEQSYSSQKLQKLQTLMITQIQTLKKQAKDTKRSLTKVQNIIKQINSNMKDVEYRMEHINSNEDSRNRISSRESEGFKSVTNDFKNQKSQEALKYQRNQGYNSKVREQPKQEEVRGIRGLLKKSKQKEQSNFEQLNSKKLQRFPIQQRSNSLLKQKSSSKLLRDKQKLSPLQLKPVGMNNLKRQLPPVKQDVQSKKKINEQNYDVIQLSSQNGQQQEYQVDQNGFLIDKYGQYVYGQDGNIMQLSQQYLQELLKQQNQQN